MSKNITINMRVNSDIKEQAEQILASMGMTLSESFNMLLHQINLKKALPFKVTAKDYDYTLNDLKEVIKEDIAKYEAGKLETKTFSTWEKAKEWLDE